MKIDFDLNRIKALLNESKELHSQVRISDDLIDPFDPEMPHFRVDVDGCSIFVGSDEEDESVFTFKEFEYLKSINFNLLSKNTEKLNFAKNILSSEFGIEIGELNDATKYVDQFSESDVVSGILQMIDGFDWVHHYVMANEKLM